LAAGRGGTGAAVIGGSAWVIGGAMTSATGERSGGDAPVGVTVGLVLFPFALLGLWSTLGWAAGRAARVGGVVAAIAAICGVGSLLMRVVGGDSVLPVVGEFTPLSPFTTGASFGTFVALVALGIAVRRTRALAAGFAWLPLALGIADLALRVTPATTADSGQLHPLPIALLGLGWIALGVVLWNAAARQSGAR
jgi:hypothetical protein